MSLRVLVCLKLKNDKVRDYIVSYIKSLALHKAAVDLLAEASPSLLPVSVDGARRSESHQTLKSPTRLNLHKFLSKKKKDNYVLFVEAAEL